MTATTAPTVRPSPSPSRGTRDPWFDNAKMTLVVLVVLGHSWTLLPLTGVTGWLYDFLYAWHVPAFVMVTGYLSRSFQWQRRRFWQLGRTVVVPYLVFETAIALFRVHVGGERLEDLYADPHWPMWYLAALFFWRLVTPFFRDLRGGLVLAVVVSLAAGLRAGDTLDLARVLGLLPFFVLGLKATPERLELLRGRTQAVVGALTLAAIGVLATQTDRWASTEWLYYRARYSELDVGDTRALVTRGVLLVVGTLGAWAFLALVPRWSGWFTRMGSATLVVYLFHGFAVKGASYAGYADWARDHAEVALALTSPAAVVLALLLAWSPVARVLEHAVDPLAHGEKRVRDAVDLAVAGAAEGMAVLALSDPAVDAPAVDDPADRPTQGAQDPPASR